MNTIFNLLSQRYTIDGPFSIAEFWSRPSSDLYRTIHDLKQESFAANHRIVFTCFDNLDDQRIKDFLIKLQKCVTFVDISNCFILIVSNRQWISEHLDIVKQQWAFPTEDCSITHEFYNISVNQLDIRNFSAILNPPETICSQPWISLDIGSGGEFKPCCYFNNNIKQEDGNEYNIINHTVEQVYNSSYMRDLRQQFIQGKQPDPCSRCWNEERDGAESKRMLLKHRFIPYSFDTNWDEDDIQNLKFLSIQTGNICNLKCRICNSGNSSKIAEEQLRQIPIHQRKTHNIYKKLVAGRWVSEQSIWDKFTDINLNIEYFDIAGGEPMLQNDQFQMLKTMVHQGRANQVQLHYNTNGTVFPDHHSDLWKKFKMVDIAVSIDNIQDRFEFERSGANWSVLQDNLVKFFSLRSDTIKIALHLAINIQNVLYLPEICDWVNQQPFDSVHFCHVYDPEILYIGNVTAKAQSVILDRLDSYVCANPTLQSFIQTAADVVRSATVVGGVDFCKYMKNLDQIRNQDFSLTHREIALAMGY
jgi:organic radical activating enzyme